jgi:hypothetical protein
MVEHRVEDIVRERLGSTALVQEDDMRRAEAKGASLQSCTNGRSSQIGARAVVMY